MRLGPRFAGLNERQHVALELLHLGQRRIDGAAAKAEVEAADAHLLESLDVACELGRLAGEQPSLAVARLGWRALAELSDTQGDTDGIGLAASLLGHLAQPVDLRLEAFQAVERLRKMTQERSEEHTSELQ